jgi:hypothetical protein
LERYGLALKQDKGHFCLIHQAGRHEYIRVGSVDSSLNRKPLDEPSKIAPNTLA